MRLIDLLETISDGGVPELKFYNGATDSHQGQIDGILWAYDGSKYPNGFDLEQVEGPGIYGYIEWSLYGDEVRINMIETHAGFRRKRIGTQMVRELQKWAKQNDYNVVWSMTTDAGEELRKSMGESIITERFKNLFKLDDKRKYMDQVWEILVDSYRGIGGMKIGGIGEPEDLLNIPMWKLVVKDGVVHGVVLYKDKHGRKGVATGTDGSDYGKTKVAEIIMQDVLMGRAYSERSKSSLGFALKLIPKDQWGEYLKTPDQASMILNKPVTPVVSIGDDELPPDAKITLQKYPELKKHGYVRDIAGTPTFKVMMGTHGNKIS